MADARKLDEKFNFPWAEDIMLSVLPSCLPSHFALHWQITVSLTAGTHSICGDIQPPEPTEPPEPPEPPIKLHNFSACLCGIRLKQLRFLLALAEIEMIFIEIYAPFTWHVYVLDICSNVNVFAPALFSHKCCLIVVAAWLMPPLQPLLLLLLALLTTIARLMPFADNTDEILALRNSTCLSSAYT